MRVPDAKGLHYLAELIRHPGRELHVVDLAGTAALREADATPTPDARARLAYRERPAELQAELENAERMRKAVRKCIRGEVDKLVRVHGGGTDGAAALPRAIRTRAAGRRVRHCERGVRVPLGAASCASCGPRTVDAASCAVFSRARAVPGRGRRAGVCR